MIQYKLWPLTEQPPNDNCPYCEGSGFLADETCIKCDGAGTLSEWDELDPRRN